MNRFELENRINDCGQVVDDIDLITTHFIDSPDWAGMDPKLADAIMNKYFSLKEIYELKFDQLHKTFEAYVTSTDPLTPDGMRDLPDVNRIELIDGTGRVYTNTHAWEVQLSLQDKGKTLKIFTEGHP